MGEDGKKVGDVEEGEISDTASVEEITEDVFNKQEVVVVKESKPKADSRVWTMQELCKYPGFRGYASGLYNLAWAQAVQNKPLNGVFVMDVDRDGNSRRSSPSSSANSSKEDKNNGGVLGKEVDKIVIDDSGDEMDVKIVDVEKEEGELEEGEIDLDSEPVKNVGEQAISDPMNVNELEIDSKVDLEKRINSIREAMESVTVVYAEKSFEGVCSGLQNTLESLREVVSESNVPTKDTLIQLYFTAIQAVHSVFCSMNNNLKDQKKDVYSRLLSLVRNRGPLFSPEQMKEIEVMKLSLDSSDVLSSTETSNKEREMLVIDGVNKNDYDTSAENTGHDMNLSNKFPLDFLSVRSLDHMNMLSGTMKPGLSNLKNKGIMLPLLDLHKDHDADSLPSPTRETTPCLPVNRLLAVGDGMPKSELATAKVAHGTVDSKMHPYETEAVKAVSSYQQKFGRSSFLLNDRLPSPTPSEDGNDGDGDVSGEVSSSSTVDNLKSMNPPILGRPIVSASPSMDNFSNQGLITDRNATPVKASSKSRDPRLRFANSDLGAFDLNQRPLFGVPNATKVISAGVVSSRKQKNIEESIVDVPALKRLRNGLDISGAVKDVKAVSGSGGWLEDTDVVGPQFANKNQLDKAETDSKKMDDGATCTGGGKPNVTVGGNEQLPVMGTSATTTLPALLKDIPVNPTMLLNILKMGQQQRLAAEAQQKSADPVKNMMIPPSSSSILGAVPLVNVSPSNAPGLLQNPTGILQVPSQITPMDEPGKIRMKPRDPRRVLHNNTLQRSGGLVSEQFKTNGPTNQGVKDNQNAQKQEGLTDTKAMPSPSIVPPDIGRQFTKNLKNIADIISVSQTSSPPIFSQDLSTQSVQIKSDKVDVKPSVSNSEDQQSGAGSTPEVGAAGPSRSPNAWGDVEHLFEGYDDEQRAAIQRERARRIDEQKKMFAARKLCLVLDLDHTLLNSAKFVEVDPVHDEILRKKEEQDREKPYRHLFRFPHMGMWTKLRPGVWNFLEKASKLYELHLYTMGNKLYATEMAKVLDPKGVLFAGRVISRGDDGDLIDGDERVPKSKDLEGVLGMESAVVIIDDSVRVWPHNKLNLIVVERYTYFPCSRRQFGLLGPSLLEIDHDERPEDGTLSSSLAVIERLHQIFFSQPSLDEVDVRNILASEQQKILGGCRIVFSRVFPVGEANPHLHPLWQTAEQFGAACTNQIDEQVTHVVANSLGTDKVNWALSTGRFVVHPGWVEASALLYRRANEQDFSIKP